MARSRRSGSNGIRRLPASLVIQVATACSSMVCACIAMAWRGGGTMSDGSVNSGAPQPGALTLAGTLVGVAVPAAIAARVSLVVMRPPCVGTRTRLGTGCGRIRIPWTAMAVRDDQHARPTVCGGIAFTSHLLTGDSTAATARCAVAQWSVAKQPRRNETTPPAPGDARMAVIVRCCRRGEAFDWQPAANHALTGPDALGRPTTDSPKIVGSPEGQHQM